MAFLSQSAFLKALGWALLNSVWQMGLLWVMFLLLTACMKKLTAQIRHSLAVIFLGIGFVWFACTLVAQYFNYSEQPLVITLNQGIAHPQTLFGLMGNVTQGLEFSLPYLSLLYFGTTFFLFFRFAIQYRYTNFICTREIHKPDASIRIYVQEIAERMGIRKSIRVWMSAIVDTPMTIGFLKPIILMPIASLNGLSTQQVEAILLHELAHIRRNDYFVNLMIASVDILLFFNPFSRLFVRTIRKEREHSCDDLVLQFQYDAHAYASALLAIEQRRVLKLSLAMAAIGKSNQLLLDRIKRILQLPVANRYNNRLVPLLFSATMMAFIAWSNPGNVIIRQILKIDAPASVANHQRTETNDVTFVNNVTAKKETTKLKKHIATAVAYKVDEAITEEGEASAPSQDYQLVASENSANAPTVVQPAGYQPMRDFSIAEPSAVEAPTVELPSTTPFVPSSSFSYFVIQDSSKPNTTSETVEEKAAKESLLKALKAIDEIDWNTLQKGLQASGQKVDVKQIREELRKSLREVDWQKINVETKIETLIEQAKLNQLKLINNLNENGQGQNGQMQEHNQNIQKKIVEDQLKCQQEVQRKEQELKKYLKVKKVRKIVEI
jgi:beta-lactamase regulating signal transducer with metallopeptidase domain